VLLAVRILSMAQGIIFAYTTQKGTKLASKNTKPSISYRDLPRFLPRKMPHLPMKQGPLPLYIRTSASVYYSIRGRYRCVQAGDSAASRARRSTSGELAENRSSFKKSSRKVY
jgi:hypothetical protein